MTLLFALFRRVYGLLLLLMPGDLRRRHGAEMRDTSRRIVEQTMRARGGAAAARAALAECLDLAAAAVHASRRAPSELRQDMAYGWRLMWRRPAFSAAVVATLALGIGATAMVFSVVNAVLLRPLPYADPERLAIVTVPSPRGVSLAISPRDYHDLSSMAPSLAAAAAFTDRQVNLTSDGEPERLDAAAVTWTFFDVVGVRLARGRGFTREEGEGRDQAVVISHGLWLRRFGGDAGALGRKIVLDGRPFTIVGIAPPHLKFPSRPHVWIPLVFTAHQLDPSQRGARWVSMVARVRPEALFDLAATELHAAGLRLAADFPRTHANRDVALVPLQEQLVGDVRPALLALLGAVALVLLIACANAANLLVARAATRADELRIRLALGASRLRLLRQSVVENFLLAGIAAACGLGLAVLGARAAVAFMPQSLPRVEEIAVDLTVALMVAATAIALAVLLGAAAALGVRTMPPAAAARATPAGARVLRRGLVVAEVAMALVLLTAAGLFVKSLARLQAVEPGFEASNVLVFSLTLPPGSYAEASDVQQFVERLRTELAARPGVESAAGIFGLPLTTEFRASSSFEILGRPVDPADEPTARLRVATPDYFRTLRVGVRSGRAFSERDGPATPGVAVVNEAAARKYWPGENPIGQRLRLHVGLSSVKQTPREIVGIVRDVRFDGLGVEAQPEVYIPHAQHPVDLVTMAVRTHGDPRAFVADARATLRRLDPHLPLAGVTTLEEIVAESVAARRFSLTMLTGFAGAALVLAWIGIYGVLSYSVGQRTREIGLRMAIGAGRGDVLRLVVSEGLGLTLIGLALGLAGAGAAGGLVRAMLFDVEPHDPSTLAAVAAALVAVALAASYLPARRAAALDPSTALRAE